MQAKQTVSGVILSPWGTPDFNSAITHLGLAHGVSQLGQSAQYIAAVTNGTPNTIVSMRVLFEVATGTQVPVRQLSAMERVNLQPGGSALVGVLALKAHIAALLTQRPVPALPDLTILSGKVVTSSVDSLTLPDGSFIGPDTLNFFTRMVTQQQSINAFVTEVANRAKGNPADLKAWLTATAQATQPKPHQGDNIMTQDLAGPAVYNRAMTLLDLINREADVAQWVATEQANQKPPLRRVQ
jgi:hypothetical protein